ncbi:MAG: hypothetical protein AAGF28_09135 [Pseudomonadota bacterium]
MPNRFFLLMSVAVVFNAIDPTTALADQQACETAARAAMLDVRHPVPMRQSFETITGGKSVKSSAVSTPDNRGMAMDANGAPVTLWADRKFYTSADKGKTWNLMSESTEEAAQAQMDGLRQQAQNATNITCAFDIELDGKRVNHFKLDYTLYNIDMKMTGEYWVDAETGFPWRIKTTSPHNVIIGNNQPADDIVVPDPEG